MTNVPPVTLEVVYELPHESDLPAWFPWPTNFLEHRRLWAGSSCGDVAMVAIALAADSDKREEEENYGNFDSLRETLQLLPTFEDLSIGCWLTLAGGVQARQGDRVLMVDCCYGVEDWRDWIEFAKTGERERFSCSVPMILEKRGEQMVIGLGSDEEEEWTDSITLPFAQLPALLEGVERDLRDFLRLWRLWTRAVAPDLSDELTALFERNFVIPRRPC